jgi:hypothetical protein
VITMIQRTRLLGIAGGVIGLAICGAWLATSMGGYGVWSHFEYSTPRALDILGCDADGVWLLVSEAMPEPTGNVEPRAVLARSKVERIQVGGSARVIEVGPSFARTLSVAADGSMWLVLQEPTRELDFRGTSRLLHARSRSAKWEDRVVPGALTGAAFGSAMVGFAWTNEAVYFTSDGAQTWRSTSTLPWLIAGHDMPVLVPEALGGGLLVPMKTAPGADGSSRVVRIGPELELETIAQWDHVSVEGVAISQDTLVVVLRPWLVGKWKVFAGRLSPRAPQFQEVWASGDKESVRDLQSSGDQVSFVATGQWGRSGYFGATTKTFMRATVGRWDWRKADITLQRVRCLCVQQEGVWTLGGWNRHVALFRSE